MPMCRCARIKEKGSEEGVYVRIKLPINIINTPVIFLRENLRYEERDWFECIRLQINGLVLPMAMRCL